MRLVGVRGGLSFEAGATRDGPASGGGGDGDGVVAVRYERCDIMSGERTTDRGVPNILGASSDVETSEWSVDTDISLDTSAA